MIAAGIYFTTIIANLEKLHTIWEGSKAVPERKVSNFFFNRWRIAAARSVLS